MMTPIYDAEQTAIKAREILENDNDSNYGVWFDRFFEYQIFKPSGKFVDKEDVDYLISDEKPDEQRKLRSKMLQDKSGVEIYKQGKKKQKKDFFSSFLGNDGQRKCGDNTQLEKHTLRQYALCQAQAGISNVYSNDWQMAIGLGNSHPLENGLLWHPTLGVPYFEGSTIKGLAKALMEKWGADPKLIKRWFGSVNLLTSPNIHASDMPEAFNQQFATPLTEDVKKALDEQATGAFIFMDAIPTQQVMIKQTMVTPHYGKWYEKGDSAPTASDTLPGDWHSPVPVEFMVVEKAVMQFSIIPRLGAEVTKDELEQISNVIKLVLEHLGIGGKTATGFGRMHSNTKDDNELEEQFKKMQEAEAKRKATEEAMKGASVLKQELVTQIDNENWRTANDTIKTEFTKTIDDWLDKLEASPDDKDAIELMIEIFKTHYAKQFKNPNNKKVKPRQKVWVERLKAL